jgi:hypothetical protein
MRPIQLSKLLFTPGLLLALLVTGLSPVAPPASALGWLKVEVLSNRADLISGGDALVRIRLPRGVKASTVRVRVGTRDVTRSFARRPNGAYEGLVRRLRLGPNVVRATAPGYAGKVTITNHPNGGPVFTGPQHGPYVCQAGAVDRKCNKPPAYRLLYKSTSPVNPDLQPYDKANPPSDVASTTTDRGVTVPFIVRQETGYQDRDQYKILTLWQPGKPWKPWRSQRQWNHKLVITHGGGCGASYTPGDAPLADFSGTLPAPVPGYVQSYIAALGKGFAVLSTALDNTGHNCNVPMQAESLMMAKERLVERYGPIRYTIGTGCSGGSIAQATVANAYPGIYQGLVTTCSYPDSLTAGAQFADYHVLRRYFEDPSRWGLGVVWLPTQMAQVEGHLTHLNAITADEGLLKAAINPETPCPGTKDTVPGDRRTRFNADTNPGGVRCSILDMMKNPLGPRPKSVWSPQEKAAGHGFPGVPLANAGVEYGLNVLKQGLITPAQFVDMNEKAGGVDINARPTASRLKGDPLALRNVYRTGLVNEANNLRNVAIINHGGPDPGIAHDYSHAYWMDARLRKAQGHTRNRVMWFGAFPVFGDTSWPTEALFSMDRWLARVERDHRTVALSAKIVQDKPSTLTDRCSNLPGFEVVPGPNGEPLCKLPLLQTNFATPRIVAGDNVASDRTGCQLKPLVRSGHGPIPFTDAEWARLQKVFPSGVCDWSKPGRGQRGAQTWLRYAGSDGKVVYGGENLAARPARSGRGLMSPAFLPLLNQ